MKELDLEVFIGLHHLQGANHCTINGCKGVDFILDDKNYTILEVRSEGYRDSACAMFLENREGFECNISRNTQVFCAHDNRRNDVLDFYDIITNKVILSVGTVVEESQCGEVETDVFIAEINDLD